MLGLAVHDITQGPVAIALTLIQKLLEILDFQASHYWNSNGSIETHVLASSPIPSIPGPRMFQG